MTKIGMLGLGRLGLPVSVAMASKFPVVGYDINPALRRYRKYEHRETGPTGRDDFQVCFDAACNFANGKLRFAHSLSEMVSESDIIFVAVQTPHQPEFDGSVRLTAKRADFDYHYLAEAARNLARHVRPEQSVAIISTVLPGTIRKYILPILGGKCALVYNPFFIAMGTVMRDFLNPEFVLLGGDGTDQVADFYAKLYGQPMPPAPVPSPPILRMSIESAELTKVAYNTYISAKIGIANTLMEICHKTPGCNIDDVTDALQLANRRIVSPAYMHGGMGDGGACHPRDGIAMSWLANKLNLSFNVFDALMTGRERQAEWLAGLVASKASRRNLGICILGKAFKAETNITAGSPAILVANILKEWGWEFVHHDPHTDPVSGLMVMSPKVFLVATAHRCFPNFDFPAGSVVIDPFRYIAKRPGVDIIPVGVGPSVTEEQ